MRRSNAERNGSNPGLDVTPEFRAAWWRDLQRTQPAVAGRLHALYPDRFPLTERLVAPATPPPRPTSGLGSRSYACLDRQLDAAVRSDTLRRAGFAAVLVLALVTPAFAQTPATCDTVPGCREERVRDFKDYVDYLETERAFCKTINKSLNATINTLRAKIEALEKAAAPPGAPTP